MVFLQKLPTPVQIFLLAWPNKTCPLYNNFDSVENKAVDENETKFHIQKHCSRICKIPDSRFLCRVKWKKRHFWKCWFLFNYFQEIHANFRPGICPAAYFFYLAPFEISSWIFGPIDTLFCRTAICRVYAKDDWRSLLSPLSSCWTAGVLKK